MRQRKLAGELRRLRESTGKTVEEVGDALNWSKSKVSRIENGRTAVQPRDVRLLLNLYEAPDDQRERLETLARTARERGWWDAYAGVLPAEFTNYIELEAEASAMRCYDALIPFGLLQTEEYARHVIRSALLISPPGEIERRVQVRLARQRMITRAESPLDLWAVLDEAVLRRRIGAPDPLVMQDQLRHLIELSQLPNITIQVLPDVSGSHPATSGAFTIMQFPHPADPDVVYIENLTSNLYVENETEIYRYTLVFDQLRATALTPEQSVAFIAELAEKTAG